MISDTRTILTSSSPNQHHTVLLHIMSLSWDISRDDSPRAKLYTRRLSLGRIGLLGLGDTDFDADSFECRREDIAQGGGDCVTGAFGRSTALREENC